MDSAQPPDRAQTTAPSQANFQVFFQLSPTALMVAQCDDPVFTIVAASDSYLQLGGVERKDILGKGVFQVFPDNPDNPAANGARNLLASFRRVIATGAPDRLALQRYDVEKPLSEGGGYETRYWSALNTPIAGADGRVEYLLHSVEEVTERVLAEEQARIAARDLEKTEKRFRQLAEASVFGFAVVDLEGGFSYLNPTLLTLLGYTEEEVAAGLVRWDQITPPEFAALDAAALHELATTGKFAPFEKAYIAKNGRRVPILLGASMLERVNGRSEVAAFILDLTERKQSERDAFLVRLDDSIRPLTDPDEITQMAARLLGEQLRVSRCTYADVENDQDAFVCKGGYLDGVEHLAGRYTFSGFGAECLRQMRQGEAYVVSDSEIDQRTATVKESYRGASIRAMICVPLLKSGQLVAAVAVHQTVARFWRQDEVDLVRSVTSRCWESIERARVARELRSSERRLRLAQKAGRIGSFEWLVKEGRVYWTPDLEALYGIPEGSFGGTLDGWASRVVAEDAARIFAEIERCVARKQSEYAYEFRAVLPDGMLRWIRGRAQFFYDEFGIHERMVGVNIDIDAQKAAENHLQQQWNTFDTALSYTPDFSYIFDLQGRFTYANLPLLTLLSRTLDEVVGRDFFGLEYPPELAARLQRQIQQVIETKQTVRDQTPFTGPAGEMRHYEYIFVPVIAKDGQVEAVAGSTRDITDQKRAEELVQEDRRRWRDLLLHAPAVVAILRGPEHRFEWVNDDYVRIVGRPAEALIGKPVRDILPEVVSQGYIGILDHVYQTGEPHAAHEALIRLGKTVLQEIYLNFVYLAEKDSDGKIDGIFVHATDVTDLVSARKQIEESEARYRFLAESIPQMVWTATPDGALDYVSGQVTEYFGMEPQEVLGSGWLSGVHPEDQGRVVERWQHSLATGEPYETEFRLRHGKNGLLRWFLVRAHSMPAPEGQVVLWVGTCTDIHDQKESEAALRRANRELEEFAYVASHDLQEPLRMVNIYTQLILKRLGGEEQTLNDFAGFVQQGVLRMQALIRDLLTFSKTVHDEQRVAGIADLGASLNEALSVLNNSIEETGAVITAAPLPLVRGDTRQMAHVFQNLLSNALKYHKANVAPQIQIAAEQGPEHWILSVTDNGIGFNPKYAERIFGLFKRLHKDEYPGTGLGLAICQRIVERYGGRMWAESTPGQGSTFYFSISQAESR